MIKKLNKCQRFLFKYISLFLLFWMVQGFSSLSLFAAEFYWENPVTISSGDARFPTVSSNEKGLSAVIWQEVVSGGKIYLSGKIFYENTAKEVSRFAGPFSYTGEVPNIFSVAVNNQGKIAVAVLSNKNAISVFSTENFETFNETVLQQDSASLVAPRIFRTSNDDFMLFATQGQNESFSLMTSVSQGGKLWSEFEAFLPSFGMQNAFIPTLIPLDNRDLVVFQASFIYENRLSYQLYATEKSVSSSYWSDATLIRIQFLAQILLQVTIISGPLCYSLKINCIWHGKGLTTTLKTQIFILLN